MKNDRTSIRKYHRILWSLFAVGALLQLALFFYSSEGFECCPTSEQQARSEVSGYLRVAVVLLVAAATSWTLRRSGNGWGASLFYATIWSVSAALTGIFLYVAAIVVYPA